MPTAAVYPAGGTTYMPGGGTGTHKRAKRTEIYGWSPSSTRRLRKFLMSVESDKLTGHGYAVTLTMRETPATAAELASVLRRLMQRYDRMGLVRLQWVIEWQGRGTPHLHMAVYMPHELPRRGWELIEHWLEVSEAYGASWGSQDVKPIESAQGWLRYLSKHAGRSLQHYQRQGMPPGWTKTGRLWGHRGDWPTSPGMVFQLDDAGWFRLRRLMRAWLVAEAASIRDPKRRRDQMLKARRLLAIPDQKLSRVRGTSTWVPEDVYVRFLALLADQGHDVRQVA